MKIEKLGITDFDRSQIRHIETTYTQPGDLIGAYGRLLSRKLAERKTTVRMDRQPEAVAR